jgi:hypothetical protein
LGRLVRSTGDITKAQDLLSTALDVATATGKPLESVANALGRAYDGNTTSLGRLGIGLSAAELKTMNFTQVQSKLTDLFGGAAARNADTYAGRIARMQVAFDEAKETIGFALLPILEKVINFINQNALPVINAFSGAFSLNGGGLGGVITTLGNIITTVFTPIINGLIKAFNYVKEAIGDNLATFKTFGTYIATYLAPVVGTVLGGALQIAGKIAGGVINVIGDVVKILNGLISGAIAGINALISAYNFANNIFGGKDIPKISAPKISVPSIPTSSVSTSVPSIPTISTPSSVGGGGGTSGGGGVATAAKTAAFATAGLAAIPTNFNVAGFRAGEERDRGTTINVNVSGALDKEGTARTIVDTLNNSFYRGTGGASNLQIA